MGKRKERRRLPELTTKAKVIFGLVVFVFVAAIAVLVVTSILRQQSLAGGSKDYKFADMDAEARQKNARKSAIDALDSGNTNEAEAAYKQAIAAEPDGAKKVEIAVDYSRILSEAKKYDRALEVAKTAESYSNDKYLISDWLARLYTMMGRKQDAIVAYKKALSLRESPANIARYTEKYYNDRIKELGS